MTARDQYTPRPSIMHNIKAFQSAEEAWFWFIAAQQARNDGAKILAGQGETIRPCEPVDILHIVNRLYRKRRLLMDHLLVLRHYGRRHMAPDPRRIKEQRAHSLWREAMERLETVFEQKGIVKKDHWLKERVKVRPDWINEVLVYERMEVSP